jgi:hypothetical protein
MEIEEKFEAGTRSRDREDFREVVSIYEVEFVFVGTIEPPL